MISFNHDPAVTDSLRQWRSRSVFTTDFGSADLRGLSKELRLRSIFSARTTNADYLQEVADVVDEILSGKINMATGRWHLMKKLKQLGYDPAVGFPQDMAAIPPAEVGSLQDLSSEGRIDLMLKTNVALTRNYGRVVEGNTDYALHAFPAWELVRLEWRDTPRGEKKVHGVRVADPHNAWRTRWEAAGESVGWQSAIANRQSPMMAAKDSPIWQAIADGAGGYEDTLGHPFPPFAFNSGMDWRAVDREEWASCRASVSDAAEGMPSGTDGLQSGPMQAALAPTRNEVREACDRLGPDFAKELLKELEDLAA